MTTCASASRLKVDSFIKGNDKAVVLSVSHFYYKTHDIVCTDRVHTMILHSLYLAIIKV